MPSWHVHKLYVRQFLEEKRVSSELKARTLDYLIDLLVDAPREAIEMFKDEMFRANRLLALILTDDRLKPLEPLGLHDWGAWRCCLPSIEALRRLAEVVAGGVGRLLVDLHLSLDYVWKRRDAQAYIDWAEKLDIDREVVEFVVRTVLRDPSKHTGEVYGA